MRALVAHFGAAPRAFLVIPLVGLFFIDFANALIVTGLVNWVKCRRDFGGIAQRSRLALRRLSPSTRTA
jgi:uncharacterized protein involved in cysteine biosynthesis